MEGAAPNETPPAQHSTRECLAALAEQSCTPSERANTTCIYSSLTRDGAHQAQSQSGRRRGRGRAYRAARSSGSSTRSSSGGGPGSRRRALHQRPPARQPRAGAHARCVRSRHEPARELSASALPAADRQPAAAVERMRRRQPPPPPPAARTCRLSHAHVVPCCCCLRRPVIDGAICTVTGPPLPPQLSPTARPL